MRSIDDFSLLRQEVGRATTADAGPTSVLLCRGEPCGTALDGAILEAQSALVPDGYLLLITDDCPYEETLHVYRLNCQCAIVKHTCLGSVYTSGILRDVEPDGDVSLTFRFDGDSVYRLVLHASPRHFRCVSDGVFWPLQFLQN